MDCRNIHGLLDLSILYPSRWWYWKGQGSIPDDSGSGYFGMEPLHVDHVPLQWGRRGGCLHPGGWRSGQCGTRFRSLWMTCLSHDPHPGRVPSVLHERWKSLKGWFGDQIAIVVLDSLREITHGYVLLREWSVRVHLECRDVGVWLLCMQAHLGVPIVEE